VTQRASKSTGQPLSQPQQPLRRAGDVSRPTGYHGDGRYAGWKDANWQEVLPSLAPRKDIKHYLDRKTPIRKALLGTPPVAETLVAEMRGRIKGG